MTHPTPARQRSASTGFGGSNDKGKAWRMDQGMTRLLRLIAEPFRELDAETLRDEARQSCWFAAIVACLVLLLRWHP